MDGVTIHQLQCFDAVVSEGGFQAAGERLGRSHSSIFAAVRTLEDQLQLRLFDRDGYRVALTEPGRAFHGRARVFLDELAALKTHARHLGMGEEPTLRVVVGDLCPLPETLKLLRRFAAEVPETEIHLHFEALSGPWERLFEDAADLILHHVDPTDTRLETIDLFHCRVIPVAAPGFLPFEIDEDLAPERLRGCVQCVIRDTVRRGPGRDYYLVEGARTWTVSDQLMKREVILQGVGWGHMPLHLVGDDLAARRLISLAGRHLRVGQARIVAARRRDRPHGPVAERLWRFIEDAAAEFREAVRGREGEA